MRLLLPTMPGAAYAEDEAARGPHPSALGRSVAALARRALDELAARRAARELARLDDRILRDIGLERWQIELAVRRRR